MGPFLSVYNHLGAGGPVQNTQNTEFAAGSRSVNEEGKAGFKVEHWTCIVHWTSRVETDFTPSSGDSNDVPTQASVHSTCTAPISSQTRNMVEELGCERSDRIYSGRYLQGWVNEALKKPLAHPERVEVSWHSCLDLVTVW